MSARWEPQLGGHAPFDAEHRPRARTEIASFLNRPPGTVLDIGCGGGATGKLIKEKFPGTRVIGIEADSRAAEHARAFLDAVICGSIDSVELADQLGGTRVDTVLLLDVLQRLYDPWHALRRIHGWLQEGTRVVASVANARNLRILDHLAGGRWDYDDSDILDITQVRYFTKSTLRQLFEQTGYKVTNLEPLTQAEIVDRVVVQRGPGHIDTRNVRVKFHSQDELEDLYALQYVVDATTLADLE